MRALGSCGSEQHTRVHLTEGENEPARRGKKPRKERRVGENYKAATNEYDFCFEWYNKGPGVWPLFT